ncbi:vWA domain-containing protein [Acrocarpospora macrocephala]|uniref:vWA domain-containing protein n=1 Tax=Acrocarpospora macrocephala TaxID=150177 RepID=UPI001478A6E7|nr:VWA domain-containing protein [Acrocarpospora macrocephala]
MNLEPVYGLRPRAFPFYIVCDVSHSMWAERSDGPAPWDSLAPCVRKLLFELESSSPEVSEAAHVSIVAFHDQAEVILPLTRPVNAINVPILPKGGQTNYADVFEKLAPIIEADCVRLERDHRRKMPVVFFVTDGNPYVGHEDQPAEVWLPMRDRLVDPARPFPAHVVAMGFGDVKEQTLCQVATEFHGNKLAYVAKVGQNPSTVVKEIVESICISISASVTGPDFVIQVPEGMRQINCGAW